MLQAPSKKFTRKSSKLFSKNNIMKKTHIDIIDPIHNFVRVYDSELKIIDTPIFQRLRRIRQLSGAHLIYPVRSIPDLNILLA